MNRFTCRAIYKPEEDKVEPNLSEQQIKDYLDSFPITLRLALATGDENASLVSSTVDLSSREVTVITDSTCTTQTFEIAMVRAAGRNKLFATLIQK